MTARDDGRDDTRDDDRAEVILPLHEETLEVTRSRRERVVRVDVVNRERATPVAAELHHERAEVTRVPIGRIVPHAPPVREEGDVTIIPVMEEVLVTERRLMLKEEVHVRRVRATHMHHDTVVLRTQDVQVTRTETSPAGDA